jgi:hypothetical protein
MHAGSSRSECSQESYAWCSLLQLISLGMVIVSVLGNLWTPPVGREFTKASKGSNSGLSHNFILPYDMQICCTSSAALPSPGSDRCCLDLQHNTVRLINYATALYFALDMLLRCIADGVLFTPSAYLLVSDYRTHSACTFGCISSR